MPLPWTFRRSKSRLHADRLAVCRLVEKNGPTMGDDLAAELGWKLDRWWNVVQGAEGLLAVTGKGWVVTKAGRRELDR